jgi:hypothetical protein
VREVGKRERGGECEGRGSMRDEGKQARGGKLERGEEAIQGYLFFVTKHWDGTKANQNNGRAPTSNISSEQKKSTYTR